MLHNEKIMNGIEDMAKTKMVKKIDKSESNMSKVDLFAYFQRTKEIAIEEVVAHISSFISLYLT